MKRILVLFCVVSLAFAHSGCKKTELNGEYALYEGYWQSSNIALRLYQNGKADYEEYSGSSTKTITGGRLVIKNGTLKVAGGFVNKKFDIDQPPTEVVYTYDDSQDWVVYEMVLDGMTFQRN